MFLYFLKYITYFYTYYWFILGSVIMFSPVKCINFFSKKIIKLQVEHCDSPGPGTELLKLWNFLSDKASKEPFS